MMSLWDALRMNMMISYQELVRTFLNYQYVLGTALVFMVIAVLMGRKMERKVIFYL